MISVRRDIFQFRALEEQDCDMLRLAAIEQYQKMLSPADPKMVERIYCEMELPVLEAFSKNLDEAWSLAQGFGQLFEVSQKESIFTQMKLFVADRGELYYLPEEFVTELTDCHRAEDIVMWAKSLAIFQITLPLRRNIERESHVRQMLRRIHQSIANRPAKR